MPIREGDGTPVAPQGIASVREGDGTVLYSSDGTTPPPDGSKVVMHDWANGMAALDSVDASFTTGTSSPPGPPPNGTHWFGGVNTATGATQDEAFALKGSLAADFVPGKVYYTPFYSAGGANGNINFGEPDTSPSNQYEARLWPDAGYRIRKNVAGAYTDFYDETLPLEQTSAADEWLDVFIWWEPNVSSYGEPRDTDGSGSGDFLLEVYKQDGSPVFSRYANAQDTTYGLADAGLSWFVAGGVAFYVGNPETGDASAFADFYPERRSLDTVDEIDTFNHNGDVFGWGDGRANYRMNTAGEFPDPPSGQPWYLVCPNPFSQNEMFSGPGQASTAQRYDLPNYLAEGERAKLHMLTDTAADWQGFMVCTTNSRSNSVRVELRSGSNRVRVLEFVAGTANVLDYPSGNTISANQWYTAYIDRTTPGSLTLTITEGDGGTTIYGPTTVSPSSTLASNEGVGLVAARSGARHAYANFTHY